MSIFGCNLKRGKKERERAESTFSSSIHLSCHRSLERKILWIHPDRVRGLERRSPSPQIIIQDDGPFNFIVAEGEEATPRFATAKGSNTLLWSARPPVLFSWKSDPASRPHFLQRCKVEAHSQPGQHMMMMSWRSCWFRLFSFCEFSFLYIFCLVLFFARSSLGSQTFISEPTCWIWRGALFSARCSAPFTRRVHRAASAPRRLTPWSASPETCGVSRLGSPDTPGICS